jgi:hypothetical protein
MRTTIAAATMCVLVAAGCAGASAPAETPVEQATVAITASYPYGYRDLDEIGKAADLVVEGRVTGVKSTGPDPATPDLPETLFDVEVLLGIKGEGPGNIVVKQTGGTIENVTYEMQGDPMLKEGDHVLLYLQRVTGGPEKGIYFILGGPQGRFKVGANGSLSTVGSPTIKIPSNSTVEEVAART